LKQKEYIGTKDRNKKEFRYHMNDNHISVSYSLLGFCQFIPYEDLQVMRGH